MKSQCCRHRLPVTLTLMSVVCAGGLPAKAQDAPANPAQSQGPRVSQEPMTVFYLRYVDASQVVQTLQQLFDKEAADFVVEPRTNALIFRGTEKRLGEVKRLLIELDVNGDRRGGVAEKPLQPARRAANGVGPELQRLQDSYAQAEQRAGDLAAKLRQTSAASMPDSEERKRLNRALQEAVTGAFAARQALQAAQVIHFRKQLETVEQTIQARERLMPQIIAKRMQDLLADPALHWQTPELGNAAQGQYERQSDTTTSPSPRAAGSSFKPSPLSPISPATDVDTQVQIRLKIFEAKTAAVAADLDLPVEPGADGRTSLYVPDEAFDAKFGAKLAAREVKVLAEPELVTSLGRLARFASGGELPRRIHEAEGSGTKAQPHGIQVELLARRAASPDRLILDVKAMISQLSPPTEVKLHGDGETKVTVPALTWNSFEANGLVVGDDVPLIVGPLTGNPQTPPTYLHVTAVSISTAPLAAITSVLDARRPRTPAGDWNPQRMPSDYKQLADKLRVQMAAIQANIAAPDTPREVAKSSRQRLADEQQRFAMLAGEYQTQLRIRQSQLDAAKDRLEAAMVDLTHYQALYEGGRAALTEVTAAKSRVEQAQQTLYQMQSVLWLFQQNEALVFPKDALPPEDSAPEDNEASGRP